MPFSIAKVVVGLPVPGPFDYQIPAFLQQRIGVGSRVYVSFGQKFHVGYVIGMIKKSRYPRLKPIIAALDSGPVLDENFLKLAKRLSSDCACTLGEAIETGLPSFLREKREISWSAGIRVPREKTAKIYFYQATVQSAAKMLAQKIRENHEAGRGLIFLVPETGQVPPAKEFLEKVCKDQVAVIGRGSGIKEEIEQWRLVKEGKIRMAVGSRSAVFAMMPDLGLMIISDEENSVYKQEPSPFYHTREVAFWRQKIDGCDLAFVTPAPTLELWKILKDRKVKAESAPCEASCPLQVIDLANYKSSKMLLSFPLQNHLRDALAAGNKTLLFLNRRGFFTHTRCRHCGFVLTCSRCQTALSFLYSKKKLVCRRCAAAHDFPKICPQCQGAYLFSTGGGVEKLESDLTRIYPQAKIAGFDKESKLFDDRADVMIATSAVLPYLKRGHFQLIAVLDFDAEINRPDFRASCRAYSLLTRLKQAGGAKMFVQTRHPGHAAITAALREDPESFYKSELKIRRELGFPPCRGMIAISLRSMKESDAHSASRIIFDKIGEIKSKKFEISEPQPDLIPKLRDKYRYTIMIKTGPVQPVLNLIGPVLTQARKHKNVILTVDVNP